MTCCQFNHKTTKSLVFQAAVDKESMRLILPVSILCRNRLHLYNLKCLPTANAPVKSFQYMFVYTIKCAVISNIIPPSVNLLLPAPFTYVAKLPAILKVASLSYCMIRIFLSSSGRAEEASDKTSMASEPFH